MSVTITIENNRQYCLANGLADERSYDCDCCDGCDCCDDGRITYLVFPWDLNIANGNFAPLWRALGFALDANDDWAGHTDGRVLAAALERVTAAQLARPESISTGAKGAMFYDVGLSVERIERYLTALRQIANEAERRESPVVWH